MTVPEAAIGIFLSQIVDPFRLGLLAALLLTAANTARHTGVALPLACGIVFVAVLIPLTFSPEAGNWWQLVGVGLATNAVVVAAALGAWALVARLRAR